jgi:ABC-type amino acid transport substrate-binding protein
LGLAQHFKMAERPLGTRGIHAVALKENPQAPELIQAVNRGLKQLKQTDAYGAIVRKHLMRLWDIQPSRP